MTGNPFDFNHRATKQRAFPDMDAAADALSSKQKKREYLGGSRLGEPCARKLQFEYLGKPSTSKINAKTFIIFAAGHALEDTVAELLRGSGLDLRTHDKSGSQFGFATAGGRIRGHIDGVVCGGPEHLGPYPYLFENKAVANKYWQQIVKKGVAAERPVYAGQVAIYQAYMDLTENPALFSIVNRDTGEIAFERIPFDAKLAQTASDRGVAVIQACEAGELMPRAYAAREFFECRMCGFNELCWGVYGTGSRL